MRKSALPFLITICFFVFSFKTTDSGIDITYGVCNSEESAVKLDLNSDMSFCYNDLSNPNKPIQVKGTYSIEKYVIRLKANNSEIKFHDKWVLSENNQIAKARKGLSFYRLAKIE